MRGAQGPSAPGADAAWSWKREHSAGGVYRRYGRGRNEGGVLALNEAELIRLQFRERPHLGVSSQHICKARRVELFCARQAEPLYHPTLA